MTPKIALQPIIYGKQTQTDLSGVLSSTRRAGYAGIELGRYALAAEQVKELLAAHGLSLSGLHSPYADIANDALRAEMIRSLAQLGGKYLICSGVADREHLAGYEQTAALFNRIGAECQKAGLTFCYHNHAWEFAPLEGGVKGIHRLAEATDPALVKLNVDVYWVHIGGEDPAAFIRRYAKRMGYYHFKDGRPGEFLPLGQGEVDLRAALRAALEVGADWIVYEQDRPKVSAEEDAVVSRRFLGSLDL